MKSNTDSNIPNDRLPDNMENSGHIYTPKFIPYFMEISVDFSLSHTQTLLIGFIIYILKLSKKEDPIFYYSNEHLAEILKCNVDTVKDALTILSNNNLIFRHTKFVPAINKKARTITLHEGVISPYLEQSDYQQKTKVGGSNPTSMRWGNPTNKYTSNKININKEILSESELFKFLDGKSEDKLPPLPF